MHFRIRRNVVQLVRTSYDKAGKKPKAVVVGRMRLDRPEIDDSLRALLTQDEVTEVREWIDGEHRTTALREELAALTLADTVAMAARWFTLHAGTPAALKSAASLVPELQSLRKALRSGGLLE